MLALPLATNSKFIPSVKNFSVSRNQNSQASSKLADVFGRRASQSEKNSGVRPAGAPALLDRYAAFLRAGGGQKALNRLPRYPPAGHKCGGTIDLYPSPPRRPKSDPMPSFSDPKIHPQFVSFLLMILGGKSEPKGDQHPNFPIPNAFLSRIRIFNRFSCLF